MPSGKSGYLGISRATLGFVLLASTAVDASCVGGGAVPQRAAAPLFACYQLARSQHPRPKGPRRREPQRLSLRACRRVWLAGLAVLDKSHGAAFCEYKDRRVFVSASGSRVLRLQAS